jgi:hypothetical protein
MSEQTAYQRLIDELAIFQFPNTFTGVSGTSPSYSPELSTANRIIANLIGAAHVDNDDTYRTLDLRTNQECIAVYNAVTPTQWDAYRDLQKDYIDMLKRVAWKNTVFSDGQTPLDLMFKTNHKDTAQNKQAFKDAMDSIDAEYTYPSGQE